MAPPPPPVMPAYGGPCLSSVLPTLMQSKATAPAWLPEAARDADQVVLLVLDGLGWNQLGRHSHLTPVLASMDGGAITSVAPSTTATALTSLTTGLTPAVHGVVGYRLKVDCGVMNVLRWNTAKGDARETVPPEDFQPQPAFAGTKTAVVTKAEFATTGFTSAHLGGTRLYGWRLPSALAVEVRQLLRAGERFVYAYYDGIDKVAHDRGFGEYYDAELSTVDRLVGDVMDVLTPGAALLVTADHGQVQVGEATISFDEELMSDVEFFSGEGRFRWLHARPGTTDRLAARARQRFAHQAWVRTRREVVEENWLGGRPAPEVEARLGDVAVVAFEPVAFLDPADPGEARLACRHGSLTEEEMLVPLLAAQRPT